MIPLAIRPKTLDVLGDMERVVGGFIRGQVIVGATIGALITIMLSIMHVKYGVLIGVAAGVLDIIPYVGAVAAFVPAVLLALFQDGASVQSLQHAALVAILFVLIFQAEGHFISPKIVSESVGLSPLWVIIAVLIGADLAGIAGMFIAVPVAGMVRVLIAHFVPKASVAEAKPELTAEPRERPKPEARPARPKATPRGQA
jgi:predicted PurR-regulated permease PerM